MVVPSGTSGSGCCTVVDAIGVEIEVLMIVCEIFVGVAVPCTSVVSLPAELAEVKVS